MNKKMKNYYFKYVVTGSIEKEFNTIKEARKQANKEKEKIYLSIYSKFNIYKEPYSDILINKNTSIIDAKIKLIKTFNNINKK